MSSGLQNEAPSGAKGSHPSSGEAGLPAQLPTRREEAPEISPTFQETSPRWVPTLGDLELRLDLTFRRIGRASEKALREGAGAPQTCREGEGRGVSVTCEGFGGLLAAPVGIPLGAASFPKSKLLLRPPGGGGGGGDGGGCRSPALSPAASGRGGAEAGPSERHASPRSRRAPGRPARLARSRLPPLRSRGIVSPRPPPPPPPPGLGHATFLWAPAAAAPASSPRLPPPLHLRRAHAPRKQAGERGTAAESGPAAPGALRRRRSPGEGGRRAQRAGGRASDAGEPIAQSRARGAARGARGAESGGGSDPTAAWAQPGRANVGAAAPTPSPPDTPRRCLLEGIRGIASAAAALLLCLGPRRSGALPSSSPLSLPPSLPSALPLGVPPTFLV